MANKPRRKKASVSNDLGSLTVSQLAARLEEIQRQLAEYEDLKAEEEELADILRRRLPGRAAPARGGRGHAKNGRAAAAPRSKGRHDWQGIGDSLLEKLEKGKEYATGELRTLAGVAENAAQSFYKQVIVPLYEAGAIKWNQQPRRASRYYV